MAVEGGLDSAGVVFGGGSASQGFCVVSVVFVFVLFLFLYLLYCFLFGCFVFVSSASHTNPDPVHQTKQTNATISSVSIYIKMDTPNSQASLLMLLMLF